MNTICIEDIKEKISQKKYVPEEGLWESNRDEYRKQRIMGEQTFKEDLCHAFGVENNPKKDLLFNIAWDKGHAYGFNSVADWFEELVELIQ